MNPAWCSKASLGAIAAASPSLPQRKHCRTDCKKLEIGPEARSARVREWSRRRDVARASPPASGGEERKKRERERDNESQKARRQAERRAKGRKPKIRK